jgi:hypothetical protein
MEGRLNQYDIPMKSPEQPMRAGMSMTVVSLLATALFISYFDRGILATASPLTQV